MYSQEVMYDNTKIKGDQAELEVFVFLKRHGYTVATPFGENQPYDFIVESPQRNLYRVQVRWISEVKGALNLSLRCSSCGVNKPLDLHRIDVFVGWDGSSCYILPTKEIEHLRAGVSLRIEAVKNQQVKGVRYASTYREAVNLIP